MRCFESYRISLFQINTPLALSAAELNTQRNNPAQLCIYIICIFSAHFESIILPPGAKTAACSQRTNSLPPAYRLVSRRPSSFAQLQCDAVAWQRQARQRGGGGRREPGGGIRARAGRQGRKRQIILPCTVRRLNLHSSETRQIEKGKNAVKMTLKKEKKK